MISIPISVKKIPDQLHIGETSVESINASDGLAVKRNTGLAFARSRAKQAARIKAARRRRKQ